MAEGEEVDDLIDSPQKLIPPEVSLQGQVSGGVSSVTQMRVKAITGLQWGRYGGFCIFRMAKGILYTSGSSRKDKDFLLSGWGGSHSP